MLFLIEFIYFRCGINVIGVSSDGDHRLLGSMRAKLKFSLVALTEKELEKCAREETNWIYAQDTIHIGTKLRNRLLKAGIILPMGEYFVSIDHLKTLLQLDKDIHHLVQSDICPKDRQNYSSLEKIMHDRVIEALDKHVPNSKATVMYLRLCKKITSSYLDVNMKPTDRIYNIWYALYFIRAWRKFISLGNKYRMNDNFITSNAYQCIEVNAHSLIYAILKLRDSNKAQLFQTHLFSSQPCESTFRQMRSLGTQNFTKINFSLYELLHMVSRIELMNTIKNSNDEQILFPEKKIETKTFELPSNFEIITAIKAAKKDALESAKDFGIVLTNADIALCELKPANIHKEAKRLYDEDASDDDTDDESDDDEACDEDLTWEIDGSSSSDDGLDEGDQNNPDLVTDTGLDTGFSKFVQIEINGKKMDIRKSRLIWMLTDKKDKLSADRSIRVRTRAEFEADLEAEPIAGSSNTSKRQKNREYFLVHLI